MRNVLICGLGAVGLTFAAKIRDNCNLKILVDEERLNRYSTNKPSLNGITQNFNYILPNSDFCPDLIIISTKSNGLDDAINNIKNFVKKNTIIISLINGISSEEKIKKYYPHTKILKSYFIGHSAVRENNNVTQDGIGEIVIENNTEITNIFEECNIPYSCAEDIDYSMWLKFTLNIFSNQTSAILNLTFGEMKNNKKFIEFAKKLILEVKLVAEKKGIQNTDNLEKDALDALSKMCDKGKTSMLQDILAKRPTEVDIFAGEIIHLGKLYNIPTPLNQTLFDLIKIKESVVYTKETQK